MNDVHTTDTISTPNDNEYETLQNNHRIDDSTNGHAAMLAGFGPSPPRLPSSPMDSETNGSSTHGADNDHPCEQPPHPEPASAHGPDLSAEQQIPHHQALRPYDGTQQADGQSRARLLLLQSQRHAEMPDRKWQKSI